MVFSISDGTLLRRLVYRRKQTEVSARAKFYRKLPRNTKLLPICCRIPTASVQHAQIPMCSDCQIERICLLL